MILITLNVIFAVKVSELCYLLFCDTLIFCEFGAINCKTIGAVVNPDKQ